MTEKLKPCPFCGGTKTATVATDIFDEWSDSVVKCSSCGAKGPPCSVWPKAEEMWNARKTEEKGGDN